MHSRYLRTITDLPIAGLPVVLQVCVRRFRCRRPGCPQHIFAERLPALTVVRGRRTHGQRAALVAIGLAVGGLPGARLGQRVGITASRATLLRLVRAAPTPQLPAPRVLGVDDWAMRKGQRYGTILVDLEQRRPVELLADRTAATLAGWLRAHARPTIISRDRGGAYAEGARQGAPNVVQVADRFHLLSNAGDTLERVLRRHHQALRDAAAAVDAARPTADPVPVAALAASRLTRVQQEQQSSRNRRVAYYEQVLALDHQGLSLRAISAEAGISRQTVRRLLAADRFPERAAYRPRRSMLTPHETYLRERWAAGYQNAHMLWEELRARGYVGGPALVRRYVAPWRNRRARRGRTAQAMPEVGAPATPPRQQPTRVWSPRKARWFLAKATSDLKPEDRTYREALLDRAPEVAVAQERVEGFGRLVRERNRPALLSWLAETERCALPELRGFAAGIRRDQAAVEAAVQWEWSNEHVAYYTSSLG